MLIPYGSLLKFTLSQAFRVLRKHSHRVCVCVCLHDRGKVSLRPLLLVELAEALLEMLRAEGIERRLVAGAAGGGQVRAALEALAAAGGPQLRTGS